MDPLKNKIYHLIVPSLTDNPKFILNTFWRFHTKQKKSSIHYKFHFIKKNMTFLVEKECAEELILEQVVAVLHIIKSIIDRFRY